MPMPSLPALINYSWLHDAQIYYAEFGFKNVNVPWLVTPEIQDITRPQESRRFQLADSDNSKCFVASAEQSFLYQYAKAALPLGTFQATTPCMRFENFDSLHTKYFLKTELIDTENTTEDRLIEIIEIALSFFGRVFDPKRLSRLQTGHQSFDIVVDNDSSLELGSYGIRRCPFLTWIYATGLAEPRASMIAELTLRQDAERRAEAARTPQR
jgi:hypothetical protein